MNKIIPNIDNVYSLCAFFLLIAFLLLNKIKIKLWAKMLFLITILGIVIIVSTILEENHETRETASKTDNKEISISGGESNTLVYNERGKVNVTNNYGAKEAEVVRDFYEGNQYWYLDISDEDKRAIYEVRSAIHKAVNSDDIEYAEKLRESLQESNPLIKKVKDNLKAAIRLAGKDYKGALEAILVRYNGMPKGNIQNRWELAWAIYRIKKSIGLKKTEDIIGDLKKKYDNSDLSYAWLAIPPEDLSFLYRIQFKMMNTPSKERIKIANYLLEEYPTDPYNDHVLFYLKKYKQILEEYPNSIIADRAEYMLNREDFLPSDCQTAKLRIKTDAEFEQLANRFLNIPKKYKGTELTQSCYTMAARVLAGMQDKYLSTKLLLNANKGLRKKTSESFLNQYVSSLTPEATLVFLHILQKRNLFSSIYDRNIISQAISAFDDKKYMLSLDLYNELPSEVLSGSIQRYNRIAALKKIYEIQNSKNSKAKLYEMAMAFKMSKHDSEHAIPLFIEYFNTYAREDEKPKVLMLLAFCYRDSYEREKMVAVYNFLLDNYPHHSFADDAMAEIGVSYLLWGYGSADDETARDWFRKTIDSYPNGNAIDNCYNWIAWSYYKEGNYQESFNYYSLLLEREPLSRFVEYAKNQIPKLLM